MAPTAEQVRLFNGLRHDGATAAEASEIVELATQMADVVELAKRHSTAWMHERRGSHGEWETDGTGAISHAMSAKAMRASRRQHPIATPRSAAAAAPAVAAPLKPDNTAAAPAFLHHVKASEQEHDQLKAQLEAHSAAILAQTEAKMDKMKAEHMATLLQTVKDNNARLAAEGEKTEKHAANQKLAIEGSVATASVIAGIIEAKLGVPDLVAIASTMVGPAVQILFEWKNRL
jgi:cell division septum initiation protein DivIVA